MLERSPSVDAAILKIRAVERVLQRLVLVAGSVAWVYFGITRPIEATAGQGTALSVVYRAFADLDLHVILPYGAVALLFGLWRRERKLRIETVRRENARNQELEKALDPGRSSSGFHE